jgi:succinate dehydrogenase hydrophobic anchor subunit
MDPSGIIDATLRITMILLLLGWNVFEGLSLRTPYPSTMVVLWDSPVWRVFLLLAIWLGAEWCPRVGLMTGLAATMYIVNMIQIT